MKNSCEVKNWEQPLILFKLSYLFIVELHRNKIADARL